jgi:protein-S-isoprenylcysteine O-methyltransferase Ste14
MTASIIAPNTSSPPLQDCADSRWQRFVDFLVRRRVRITIVVFALLIAEDVLVGVEPHDLTNFRDMKTVVGCLLVFGGLLLRSWAAGILQKDSQLSTSGPYGIIRNPLYVGSFLMMIGFCTLIDDRENIWFVLGPLLFLYVLRVMREERSLSELFGDQWRGYVRAVPRFIPRRIPSISFADWNLDQWLHNREYRAVGAVFLGMLALQTWRLF